MLPLRASLLSLSLLLSPWVSQAALPVSVDGQILPSLAPMLDRTTPAVVNISTITAIRMDEHPMLRDPFFRWFFDAPPGRQQPQRQRETQSLGSGIIVDAGRGYVLTNHHVIDKADEIRITLHDGRSLEATLVGTDPDTDVAVLQVPAENLTSIRYANSDQLRVGDFVVAIGNPFGLSQTVTSGIVSAIGRSGLGIEGYENFIQTDASINPGNSGGPLVNLNGELVGMNTAILAPGGGNVGIGFAIPINMARAIMDQIIDHGGVKRGLFGISMQDLNPDLAKALEVGIKQGALVAEVQPDSPAAQAGLQVSDIITRLNDRDIHNGGELRTQLALLRIGAEVKLDILRDGEPQQVIARIADPYANYKEGAKVSRYFSGALLKDINDDSNFGRHPGIAVGTVKENSPAARTGIQEGDVILEANRKRVKNSRELSRIIRQDKGLGMLRIRRGDQLVLLVAR